MSAVGQAQGQVLRTLQIYIQSLQRILLMRDTGKYFTVIEMLFFEHLHVYFMPNIGTLGIRCIKQTVLPLWSLFLVRNDKQ